MNLTLTSKLPNKPGYYWYCNFGEHTPTIVEVTKDFSAQNEEFCFEIKREKFKRDEKLKVDGYYYGQELWCYIPNPFLPNGKQVKPNCY